MTDQENQTAEPRAVRFVAFPTEAVDTIDCPVTGKPMPAVIVAQFPPQRAAIACPHCPWHGGTMRWHWFDLSCP